MSTALRPSPLTFVIPVGSYHTDIAERAIQSVLAQSVYCAVVVVYDHARKGAGWARNRGLEQVKSNFCAFLDADDWLEPDFAEKCLRAYDGRHYIYTDWHTDHYVEASCTPWNGRGDHHIITTLLPTVFVRRVGGFDEQTEAEDSDFYWKLTRSGLCGARLPEALFHYGRGGLRAQALRDNPKQNEILRAILERYKGLPMPDNCGGCGTIPNDGTPPNKPANDPFEGAVLAEALWAGNRQERGRATGLLYPRTGNRKRLWVHPRDVDAAPHLFARVVELPPPVTEDDLTAWRQFAGQMREAYGVSSAPEQVPAPAYAQRGEVAPDVGQVLRLYQQR